MKHPSFRIACCTRLVIGITGLLFGLQGVWASDALATRESNHAEETSISLSTSQTAPDSQDNREKPGKYDVSRIGQRSVGHGLNLYSLQKERALGEAMASAIDRGARFVSDPAVTDYIRQLAQKIARNSDAEMPFTIKVIDNPDVKVFALPGGFLYVSTGSIMDVDNEAELAALMAHEIAHVAARHATRLATRRRAWNTFLIPLSYLSGPAALGVRQISPIYLKKLVRDAEAEADLLGIEYQYAAGYDPQAFVDALGKLHGKETRVRGRTAKGQSVAGGLPLRGQIAGLFANYPPTEERIHKVQNEIATLLPSRDEYIVDTSEFQEVKARLARANQPILRRRRAGEGTSNGPVMRRRPPQDSQE